MDREISAKIVIIGEPSVGKTSLRRRYMGKGFKTSYLPTLGADFAINRIEFDNGAHIRVQIWDLAGQEYYDRIFKHYLKNTDGAIIVFDLSRPDTFTKLPYWINKLKESTGWPIRRLPIIIIGNKSDLNSQDINESQIQEYIDTVLRNFAGSHQMIEFFPTSAKTGSNVPIAFEMIAREILAIINEDRR